MTTSYEHLLINRVGTDGRVARLTLNRPEKMNALGLAESPVCDTERPGNRA